MTRMITRRDALAGTLAAFYELCASHMRAQTPAARQPVFKHDLPNLTMDDWEVTVSQVDFPPGRVGRPRIGHTDERPSRVATAGSFTG